MAVISIPHCEKRMLSFFLTSKCNLDCRYCYTNKRVGVHSNQTLPFNFAKLLIDEQIKSIPHIRFFGAGEPTQEFELMKKIKDYAYKKVKNKLVVEIQTNGVFSERIKKWLARNVDIIWVSFDGVPEIQNYFRPIYKTNKPSSPIIEKNVKYLTRYGKGMTGARMTITEQNLYRQIEIIDYFNSLGIRTIWTDPIFPTVENIPTNNGPLINMDQYVNCFIEASNYACKKNIFYGSFLACNFDNITVYHCRSCLPMPHLTTDGYVSACDMALFGKDNNHMAIFIYGKWDERNNKIIYDQNKIKQLQSRNVDNMPGCKNCKIKYNCGGYCLGEVVNETGDLFGKKEYSCKAIKKLSRKMKRNFGTYKYLHP